jgi:hypothetical protein
MVVGNGFTFRDVDRVVDPKPFVQLMPYVVVSLGETEADPDPSSGRKPDPVQASPLLDDHESVDEAPSVMLAGPALNESVGAVDDASARPLWVFALAW